MSLAFSRRDTHAANTSGCRTASAASGRNVGYMRNAGARRRIDGAMMRKIVARIVGGADGAHFEFAKNSLRGEFV